MKEALPGFPWAEIETVLLDMDGTLLDLQFDDYFWLEHVPRRYAEKVQRPLDEVRPQLFELFRRKEGTLDWYCVDHWSETLGLDIARLKQEVNHLIRVHPHVIPFLEGLRSLGKRRILVTNAHGKSLRLKLQRTELGSHLDALVCAHDFGIPKEDVRFWDRLQAVEPFRVESALLIDDSAPVLRSAQTYGIRHLIGILRPNSKGARRPEAGFPLISDFRDLLPGPDSGR